MSRIKAETFWRNTAVSVSHGERVVLVAEDATGTIVGTVQVVWAQPENQPHRGDVAKMLVHRRVRYRGVGVALLLAAERSAFSAGKTLLLLDTVAVMPDVCMHAKAGNAAARFRTTRYGLMGSLPGQVLQIASVTTALPTRQGQSLKMLALFNGRPIAAVKVLTDFVNDPEAKPLLTATDGTVTVKVRNQGLNVIFASHEVSAGASEDADVIQYTATLSFATPVKEE